MGTTDTESGLVRREVVFSGRVQGVFFRATAQRAASAYAVTGWVRNEPDGTVRLQIQGAPSEIDAALADLRAAKARNIEHEDTRELDPDRAETGFRIVH